MNKRTPPIPEELYRYLAAYDFPGNVRELKSMVYDAIARHRNGPLAKESFLQAMGNPSPNNRLSAIETMRCVQASDDRMPTLKEAEEALIKKALELAGGNQGVAARYLGITRQGLNKILHRQKAS